MIFTQAHQLATLFLLFTAPAIEAKPYHRSHSKRAPEDAVHARCDVASSPMAFIQVSHNEHIINVDTLKQAIEDGRKSQQAKASKLSALNSYAQTSDTYDVPATKCVPRD